MPVNTDINKGDPNVDWGRQISLEHNSMWADVKSEAGRLSEETLNATFVGFGAVDPETFLPPGTEYVWNKTDGAGTLLDIISGVVSA